MNQDIKDQIKGLLIELTGRNFTIADDQDLASLAGVDSLLILQFMVALEQKFGVDFQDGDIETIFKNINNLADYLISKKNG